MLSHNKAAAFLFLEGFASIAIQFLILRQITPFVGSSVIIASLVISLFLASLAIGYGKGGNVANRPMQILSLNLFKAAMLLGFFGSYMFVAALYHFFSSVNSILLVVLYLLFVMVPIVYFVAQTIPILVNSMDAESSGKKAGDALLFSTVGNVFGGILTTLVIMYYLGVSWALVITVSILFALSVSISVHKKKSAFLVLFIFPLILAVNIGFSQYKFVAQTPYANYEVHEDQESIYFISNKGYASKRDKKNKQGYAYIEKIKGIIAIYGRYVQAPEVLVLGAGGFSLMLDEALGATIHYVDIDEQILAIAEKNFLKEKVKGRFSGEDARVFLRGHEPQFDFIVVDAYTSRYSIPGNLTSVEFYRGVSKKLKADGLMITNIIANPFMADDFSKRIDNTIRAAFLACFTHVVQSGGGVGNILYVCSNNKYNSESESEVIYTDNDNKSTVDFFNDRVQ